MKCNAFFLLSTNRQEICARILSAIEAAYFVIPEEARHVSFPRG